MARPPKDPSRLLAYRLSVPVSPSELEELRARSQLAGLSLSVYVRLAALGRRLPRPVSAQNRRARVELSRLATNLAQLAYSLSYGTSGTVPPAMVWETVRLTRSVRNAVVGEEDGGAI
jgi:hypothetical protein